MFRLTEQFQDYFEFQDIIVHVDMSFDNILRMFEMIDDEDFAAWEKPFIALQILLENYDSLEFNSYEEQFGLFKYVMKEFLDIDIDQKLKEQEENGDSEPFVQKKIMDYMLDADLIFASFLAVYRIDLFEMQGKLHWKKFKALLEHLDDNSAFKQVISYRQMKVPSEKEATKDYIAHVQKMKRQYALDDDSSDTQSAFDSLATIFKGQAKKGGN